LRIAAAGGGPGLPELGLVLPLRTGTRTLPLYSRLAVLHPRRLPEPAPPKEGGHDNHPALTNGETTVSQRTGKDLRAYLIARGYTEWPYGKELERLTAEVGLSRVVGYNERRRGPLYPGGGPPPDGRLLKTERRREEWRDWYACRAAEGMTLTAMGALLGVTRTTVAHDLDALGIARPDLARNGRRKLTATLGQRFGRGVVMDPGARSHKSAGARLRCDCGAEYVASLWHLHHGYVRSCGCYARDAFTAVRLLGHKASRTHGLSKHSLYGTWNAMLWRCENPGHEAYHRYGGRGIKVCERWHDVSLFIADIERLIGPRPDGRTLDRIDSDGNYEPGNVRWATSEEQNRNTARYAECRLLDRQVAALWQAGETSWTRIGHQLDVSVWTVRASLERQGLHIPQPSWESLAP
jgi:hypothetical protein